ncbi:MAG: FHA domain-containing protein [Polyangiaceae bacterium]|nr:FHA domain-containing protein [Polyangiaceae bacterium]
MYLVVPPGGRFRETRRVELGPEPLRVGRSEANDVRVDVPGVDDEHARISEVAVIAIGADCAIGDVPLDAGARRLVMPGDEVQIGSVVVALEGDDPSLSPQSLNGDPSSRTIPAPKVRVVEGSNFGDELVLTDEGREYVVGRHDTCDLVLEDREVSREHLRIKRRGHCVFIQDLSSTRGSWLGRSTVYPGATVEWSRPRMLRVGATVLSLELPAEIRRALPAAHASAPMTPEPRPRLRLPRAEASTSVPSQPVEVPRASTSVLLSERASARRLHAPPANANVPQTELATASDASASTSAALLDVQGIPGPSRKAWKKTGATFSRTSGFIFLALAALAILGVLFVIFSLLED